MHKVWAVIRREFIERVRTRQFVIGTILGPVLFGALMVVPILLARNTGMKRVAVLDGSEQGLGDRVADALRSSTRDGKQRFEVERVPLGGRDLTAMRDSMVSRVDRRELGDASFHGVVVVTEQTLETDTLEYFGSNVSSMTDMGVMSRVLNQAVLREKLTRNGLDAETMMRLVRPLELKTEKVSQGELTGESGEASFALAYVMSMVLYMALLLYGMQVMTSTVEEKTNRVNEVLVSSLKPFELLMGKVIGVGSVGLFQLTIWLGTAYALSAKREAVGRMLGASPEAVTAMPIPSIPLSVFVVFLLFFLLGFFFYASAYAAVGSSCNTVQETQQASMPLTLLIVMGLFLMFRLLDDPSGGLGRVLSLVPPFAPFVTPVRNSLSPLPLTDLLASAGVMVLGVLGMTWLAGRIYRVGILMYGKRPTLREMFRWVKAR